MNRKVWISLGTFLVFGTVVGLSLGWDIAVGVAAGTGAGLGAWLGIRAGNKSARETDEYRDNWLRRRNNPGKDDADTDDV